MAGIMQGKKGLVMGVANDRSIAWGCAQALAREGARLAFSYQSPKAEQYVLPLFEQAGSEFHGVLDVLDEEAMRAFMEEVGRCFDGQVDFLVHAIAGGPQKGELGGGVSAVSREGFINSLLISVYSLNLALRFLRPFMAGRDAAAVTFSYLGSRRVMPAYDVMGVAKAALDSDVRYLASELGVDGIRVNAIESGSIMTRAAGGIKDYDRVVEGTQSRAPLSRPLTVEHIGDVALFLVSDLSRMITGHSLPVDGGFSILGFSA